MGTATAQLIGPELAALLARPVSANVASRDAAQRPHLARSLGLRMSGDAQQLTVFLSASTSAQLLADLRANGEIAVVVSDPATNRTVQIKSRDAHLVQVQPHDLEHLRAHREAFAEAIAELGFLREVALTVLGAAEDDIVAVRCTPQQGFDQTPGPRAGQALEAGPR